MDKTNSDKKLTLVVSTKLSIESYKALQTFTNKVYQEKGINRPTISEFLRFIINHIFSYPCPPIPEYEDIYTKPKEGKYDIFYIVTVPENNTIDYTITEKTKTVSVSEGNGINRRESLKKVELTYDDRMYVDEYTHSLSVRLPPINEQIDFKITYRVMPQNTERLFFQTVVFTPIGSSLFFTLISLDLIKPEWSLILIPIVDNLNAIFGGIATISIAAIGFSNKPMLTNTKFWFIIPIMISAVGFLFNKQIDSNGSEMVVYLRHVCLKC